jgi:hypothetical protein
MYERAADPKRHANSKSTRALMENTNAKATTQLKKSQH